VGDHDHDVRLDWESHEGIGPIVPAPFVIDDRFSVSPLLRFIVSLPSSLPFLSQHLLQKPLETSLFFCDF